MPYITALPHRVVLSGQASTGSVPLLLLLSLPLTPASRRPSRRIDATSQRARIALVWAVQAVGNWRGGMRGTRENREGVPGDV
jgi:hypothetical protein